MAPTSTSLAIPSAQVSTRVQGGTSQGVWDALGTGGQIGVIIAAIVGGVSLLFGLLYLSILVQRRWKGTDWLSNYEKRDRQRQESRLETEKWLLARQSYGAHSRSNSDSSTDDESKESATADDFITYALPSSPLPSHYRSLGDMRETHREQALRKGSSMGELRSSADFWREQPLTIYMNADDDRRPL